MSISLYVLLHVYLYTTTTTSLLVVSKVYTLSLCSFKGIDIDDEGCKYFAEALKNNSSLTYLK